MEAVSYQSIIEALKGGTGSDDINAAKEHVIERAAKWYDTPSKDWVWKP